MSIGTPLGLAFASGMNAYLPLLSFAIAVRWLHLYKVNPDFAFITQDWFMIALVVLTVVDFIADKIPLIDHTWDATHTVVHPIAGALVAAASINHLPEMVVPTSSSSPMLGVVVAVAGDVNIAGAGLLVILILGGMLAAMSHTAKATTRLISTFITAGLFNTVLSVAEDVLVFFVILLSLFLPVVMLILIVLFFIILGPRLFGVLSRRLSRRW